MSATVTSPLRIDRSDEELGTLLQEQSYRAVGWKDNIQDDEGNLHIAALHLVGCDASVLQCLNDYKIKESAGFLFKSAEARREQKSIRIPEALKLGRLKLLEAALPDSQPNLIGDPLLPISSSMNWFTDNQTPPPYFPTSPFLSPPYSSPIPLTPTPPSYTTSPYGTPSVVISPPPPTSAEAPWQGLWCVAKPTIPEPVLEEAMNFACGVGAECEAIQSQGPCFTPDTVVAHASYAFNNYWQMTKASGGTCDFGGTGMFVTVDPSYGGCHFIFNA
eukprot:Gb_02732 [translate_table: standard]